jgi:hypothetical protein
MIDGIIEPAPAAADDRPGAATWSARSRSVRVGPGWTTLRLAHFPRGWIASADSVEGPTLGVDPSPYLAASRALAPLGIGLEAAMDAVAELVV